MSDLTKFCKDVLYIIEPNKPWFRVILEFLPFPKPNPIWFSPYSGLCNNASRYDSFHGTHAYSELRAVLQYEAYPFNYSPKNYSQESGDERLYKNEKRLAFLRKYATSQEKDL